MNADHVLLFPQIFTRSRKTGVDYRRIFCGFFFREIVMTTSCMRQSISRAAIAAAVIIPQVSWANAALASQGPGGGMGTAGHLTQVAMAILVYGASALVVAAGLIGAARRQH
jgi:cytochrome c oxidase assembly factor CtaG